MEYKGRKTLRISKFYGVPYAELLRSLYVDQKLLPIEIAEKFAEESGVSITPRVIQTDAKRFGFARTHSRSIKLAILRGRKSYDHLKKSVKAKALRKGISLKLRYEILKRDNFRCILCGIDATETRLVIDHVIPIVKKGTNEISNLRTLCFDCNHGKMISEKEK